MLTSDRVYVAGHRGLVGSAILRALEAQGFANVLTRTHAEMDLCDRGAVRAFVESEKPEFVFLAAAKVGGILANNTYPADFIATNLEIQSNVIQCSHEAGVKRLLFLGSSCIYPKDAPQPIREDSLLTGPLEPTNRSYALAKIAGIEMCWAYNRQFGTRYLAAMPCNLYGPGDNFDLRNSHVLPALIRKAHQAKQQGSASMEVWGSGTPRRELLYSDDLAAACLYLMQMPDEPYSALLREDTPPLINIGIGDDITICELAELVCRVVGFHGELTFDATKPDGTMRKVMDVSRIRSLGWSSTVALPDGIRMVYEAVEDSL
jgi:GDP-L-fucose synthase